MPHVADWLSHHAEPVREMLANAGRLGGPDELEQAVDANVLVQLENLRAHPCVAEALAAGRSSCTAGSTTSPAARVRAYDEMAAVRGVVMTSKPQCVPARPTRFTFHRGVAADEVFLEGVLVLVAWQVVAGE